MPQSSTSLARIKGAILVVRGQRVLLDTDLAALYGVETRAALNQAVSRNRQRFPEDFMLRLAPEEAASLRSQIVILEAGRGVADALQRVAEPSGYRREHRNHAGFRRDASRPRLNWADGRQAGFA